MSFLKPLAIVTPGKEAGEKVRKLWGALRHTISMLSGFVLGLGLLKIGGVKITPEHVDMVLPLIDLLVDNITQVIAAFFAVISFVSSWFDKED